jgi:hypothetical protein
MITSWKQLYKIAGSAFVAAGVIYIALSIILITVGGTLPASGKELLNSMATQGLLMQIAMILFIVKDVAVLFAFPVLAIALSKTNREWPLVAVVFASVAMILDIISGLIVLSLRPFADAYLAASNTLQPVYLLNADFIFEYIWRVETPFMVGLLSLSALIFSVVMRKGSFGNAIPILGMTLGVIGVVGAFIGLIQPVLLLSVWYIAVGLNLYQLNPKEKTL